MARETRLVQDVISEKRGQLDYLIAGSGATSRCAMPVSVTETGSRAKQSVILTQKGYPIRR